MIVIPWKPLDEFDEFPTLGWHVADQMMEFLAQPDSPEFKPFTVTLEQQEILNELYRLDPETGRRKVHRGVLSRSRGWGKSPFVAGIGIAEGLFEVVFDGWDANGQPVAKPWSRVRTPMVLITATTEDQTDNTWLPLLEMLREGSAVDEFAVDPMDTFVALPKGKIMPITASPNSVKGARAVFASLDQTETWLPSNGGVKFARVLRANATKLGGFTLETPNAYVIGEKSVAEKSAKFAHDIREGRIGKHVSPLTVESFYYDHRQARSGIDFSKQDELIAGLRYAYGDSSNHPDGCVLHDPPCAPGWAPIDRIAADFYDTSNDVVEMSADFLNQIDSAFDAFVTDLELNAIQDTGKSISRDEPVVLGFDGSEGRKRGVADSTVLVGYAVRSKHLFKIGLWEQPEGPTGEGWKPNKKAVNAAVDKAHRDFNVIGFAADPSAGWAGDVKVWEAKYGSRYKVKISPGEPIRWRQRDVTYTCESFDNLYSAIVAQEITYDGDPAMTRHFLNARRDPRRGGYVLKKPDDDQDFSKIDLAWGAMFAFALGVKAQGVLAVQRLNRPVIRRLKVGGGGR